MDAIRGILVELLYIIIVVIRAFLMGTWVSINNSGFICNLLNRFVKWAVEITQYQH